MTGFIAETEHNLGLLTSCFIQRENASTHQHRYTTMKERSPLVNRLVSNKMIYQLKNNTNFFKAKKNKKI